MMFLGMYRQARTAHAQGLTGETFVSLGSSCVSARDVCARGGLLALAVGRIRNHAALCRALNLPYDAQMSAVVMRAYGTWGADYPRHIEGAAVTAVIDRAEDRLILSRDRMGALPVYYAWRARSAAFAGHVETLLRAGVAGRVVDNCGLCEIFAMNGVNTPGYTPFRDIRRLEPGCVLVADARGTRIKRYFAWEAEPHSDDFFTIVEAARDMLKRSVCECAGLAPGVMLGGAGSRVLLKLYGDCATGPTRAYNLNLTGDDDKPSREEAARLGAEYREANPAPEEVFELLPEATLARGLPGSADADAALLAFSREIAKTSAGVLADTGARELLAASIERSEARGFPWLAGEGLCKYLKPSVRERIRDRQYLGDRLHEALDRVPARDTIEDASERARMHLYLSCALPAECERLSLMLGRAGVTPVLPFMDERLALYLLGAPRRALSAEGCDLLSAVLSEDCSARPREGWPRDERPAYARLVREEILRVSADRAQPLCELIDIARVQEAARRPDADARSLGELLSVNDWMMQYEVETEL